jgi:hypothetical protein
MKYRKPYSEVDMLNMLAHCRQRGHSVDHAMKLLVAKTPVGELWALKGDEVHEDAAGAAPDERCPDCPHRPKDDDPADAPASAGKSAAKPSASASWGAVLDAVNAGVSGGVTANAAPLGAQE